MSQRRIKRRGVNPRKTHHHLFDLEGEVLLEGD
jgi:hypothetical protein